MRQKQASLDFFLKTGKKENISPLVLILFTINLQYLNKERNKGRKQGVSHI